MSNQPALDLALETLSEIFKESSSLSSILRRCYTVNSMLGKEKEQKWIEEELNGYVREGTMAELKRIVPSYRRVKLVFKNSYGTIVVLPEKLSSAQDYIITQSIGEIESSIDSGLYIYGPIIDILREAGIDVAVAYVSNNYLRNILEQVKNRALQLVNSILKKQDYPKISGKSQGQLSIIIHDQQTEEARLLLYTLENKLRQFVSSKIREKNGNIDPAFQKDWESSKKKEFLPPRKPLECDLINYSTFDQIKRIITQNENWSKIFREYFGRPDGVMSRINELDDIRDTIAHNRIISNFDFESLKTLHRQILGCLEK